MKKKIISGFLFLLVIFLVGCTKSVIINNTAKFIIEGDKIYKNGELYAELKHHKVELEPTNNKIQRGLSIYYYPFKKEVWIYPEEGLKEYYTDKSEFVFGWVYDVKISEDCNFITYKTKDKIIDNEHKFRIEFRE